MLVLTRKQNEGVLIGKDIKITIVNIDGDKIRIGIDAPKNIRVIRAEMIVEIGQENRMAACSEFVPIQYCKDNSTPDLLDNVPKC